MNPLKDLISKRYRARWLMAILCLHLTGCDRKDWEASGYQDGYAATINTACQFRTSLIHGKWDNEKYARDYARGSGAGAAAVSRDGCEKLK